MSPFPVETFRESLRVYGYEMSDLAVEPPVRQKIRAFLEATPTPAEMYDFCQSLADLPFKKWGETPGGVSVSAGDIDAFGHELFNVKQYYVRPGG